MSKPRKDQPTDYGAVALRIIGKVALTGDGGRKTLLARRRNGTAHICALLLQDAKSGHARHAVNITGTAIDRLRLAGLLGKHRGTSQPRYDAAIRFRRHWHAAGQEPNVAMRYERGDKGESEMTPEQERVYEYWRNACKALGPKLVNIVIGCCCFDEEPAVRDLTGLLKGLDLLAFEFYS